MAKLLCKKILGDMIKVVLALVVVVAKGALLTVTGVALLVI